MNRERWEYLKILKPQPPRYLHVSVSIVPKSDSHGHIIFVAGSLHSTYNVGCNKAKRDRKALQRQQRAKINERRMRVTD